MFGIGSLGGGHLQFLGRGLIIVIVEIGENWSPHSAALNTFWNRRTAAVRAGPSPRTGGANLADLEKR